jgi:hypothetical protein
MLSEGVGFVDLALSFERCNEFSDSIKGHFLKSCLLLNEDSAPWSVYSDHGSTCYHIQFLDLCLAVLKSVLAAYSSTDRHALEEYVHKMHLQRYFFGLY